MGQYEITKGIRKSGANSVFQEGDEITITAKRFTVTGTVVEIEETYDQVMVEVEGIEDILTIEVSEIISITNC